MKADRNGRSPNSDVISGTCYADPNATTDAVTFLDDKSGTNIAAAEALARASDVVVVFASTNSGEGTDRKSLSLDNKADGLISAVAKANKRTIVVAVSPGAILMPWRDEVGAILLPFLPGQEYGRALADILFGVVSPSAKLPLTLPSKENECPVFTEQMWPGIKNAQGHLQADYSERLNNGYRCYDAHHIEPAAAFGSGAENAFVEPFCAVLKTTILPRQARDKRHRKS